MLIKSSVWWSQLLRMIRFYFSLLNFFSNIWKRMLVELVPCFLNQFSFWQINRFLLEISIILFNVRTFIFFLLIFRTIFNWCVKNCRFFSLWLVFFFLWISQKFIKLMISSFFNWLIDHFFFFCIFRINEMFQSPPAQP